MSRGPEIQLESLAQFVEEKTTVSYKTQAQIWPLGQEVPMQGLPGVGRMHWRKCEDVPVPSCTLLWVSLHGFGTGKQLPFVPSQWGFSSTRHQMLWSKHSALRNLSHKHPLVPSVKSFCEHSGDFFPVLLFLPRILGLLHPRVKRKVAKTSQSEFSALGKMVRLESGIPTSTYPPWEKV